MTHILFIHGAFSSPLSFNYIVEQLKKDKEFTCAHLSYNSLRDKVPEVVETAKEYLQETKEKDILVVGHSLGGLVALGLEGEEKVKGIVTISSPLSGIKINTFFRIYLMAASSILKDLMPESLFIRRIKTHKYTKTIDIIASCNGHNDYINEPSDNVISVASQVSWKPETAKIYALDCNHFESLLCEDTVEIIKNHLT